MSVNEKILKIVSPFPLLMHKFKQLREKGIILHKIKKFAIQLTNEKKKEVAYSLILSNPQLELKLSNMLMHSELELRAQEDKDAARRYHDYLIMISKDERNKSNMLIWIGTLGISLCVATLIFYKDTLNTETISIISTLAGIFVSYIKDVFNNTTNTRALIEKITKMHKSKKPDKIF